MLVFATLWLLLDAASPCGAGSGCTVPAPAAVERLAQRHDKQSRYAATTLNPVAADGEATDRVAAGLATTSADADSGRAGSAPRAAAASTVNAALVRRALDRMDSDDQLRIEGDFGQFHGYASTLDVQGLRGLRVEPSLTSTPGTSELTWEHIYRIDKRGSSAASGAVHGAVIVGVSTGLLTVGLLAALGVLSDSEAGPGGATLFYGLAGTGVGAAVGGLIGGAVGAAVPKWHRVYER